METLPFDPADYLDSEEGIEAYLADARSFGSEALSAAVEVVARARAQALVKRAFPPYFGEGGPRNGSGGV